MSFRTIRSGVPKCVMLLLLLLLIVNVSPAAQLPELLIDVGDTVANSGEQQVLIPVYLSNYIDTVAGFNLWFQLDRPDIGTFSVGPQVVYDTTRWRCTGWDGTDCIDSLLVNWDTLFFACQEWQGSECVDSIQVSSGSAWDFFHMAEWDFWHVDTTEVLGGGFDTTGTLVSGWEWVDGRSLSGYGTDLNIAGIADMPGGQIVPGIFPQQGGVLIYLVFDVFDIPDTITDRTVNILVQTDFLDHFSFSDPSGQSLGLETVIREDTSCFICLQWVGEECLNWQQVSMPHPGGCDSMWIEIDTISILDTTAVLIWNGSLTIRADGTYGDFNDDGSVLDISDLVYFVSFMFQGGPPIVPEWVANCNYDGSLDIADLVCWVGIMFPPQ